MMAERIPDEHAQILWNEDENLKISSVHVIDIRDHDLQETIADRYDNDNGASVAGWLSDIHPIANPAGFFAYLAFRNGFASSATTIECLREFSQIESAEWARQMLALMERGDNP